VLQRFLEGLLCVLLCHDATPSPAPQQQQECSLRH
jgi:hypothetical protein